MVCLPDSPPVSPARIPNQAPSAATPDLPWHSSRLAFLLMRKRNAGDMRYQHDPFLGLPSTEYKVSRAQVLMWLVPQSHMVLWALVLCDSCGRLSASQYER